MFGVILLWIELMIIFSIVSIMFTFFLHKHRYDWSKSEQYFTLFMMLANGIIAITLIVIGYPYSNRVYAYNSIQTHESTWVVIYGFIILIIGLIVSIIFKVKESKKGKLNR